MKSIIYSLSVYLCVSLCVVLCLVLCFFKRVLFLFILSL